MQSEAEALLLASRSTAGHAQITFVKTRADAVRIAASTGAACWHSKLEEAVKHQALQDFSQGHKRLVATYGLGVGMNLKVIGFILNALTPLSYFNRFVVGRPALWTFLTCHIAPAAGCRYERALPMWEHTSLVAHHTSRVTRFTS